MIKGKLVKIGNKQNNIKYFQLNKIIFVLFLMIGVFFSQCLFSVQNLQIDLNFAILDNKMCLVLVLVLFVFLHLVAGQQLIILNHHKD